MLVTSLFKMALEHSIEVLSGVPKCRKAVMYFMEKIFVSSKLLLQCESIVGSEFKLYTLNKASLNRNTKQCYISIH